ncbi:50S ribosomal protein L6, partial [bacterium]
MSRIGKKIIEVPDKVTITEKDGMVTVKGPKGEKSVNLPEGISVEINDKIVTVVRAEETKPVKSKHGLIRTLISNAVDGVNDGFKKTLIIEGVGYKAELRGNRLSLSLGFSHPILVIPPDGIEFQTPTQTSIVISGSDKQLVGEVSSKLRKLRPPEPYKGKGVRYEGETML